MPIPDKKLKAFITDAVRQGLREQRAEDLQNKFTHIGDLVQPATGINVAPEVWNENNTAVRLTRDLIQEILDTERKLQAEVLELNEDYYAQMQDEDYRAANQTTADAQKVTARIERIYLDHPAIFPADMATPSWTISIRAKALQKLIDAENELDRIMGHADTIQIATAHEAVGEAKQALRESLSAPQKAVELVTPSRTHKSSERVHIAAQAAAQRILGSTPTKKQRITVPIAIAGSGTRAGKDTVANMIERRGPYVKFNVSDALNKFLIQQNSYVQVPAGMVPEGTAQYMRYADVIEAIGYEDAKDIPDVRRLLRTSGTDAARGTFGMGIWNIPVAEKLTQIAAEGHSGIVAGVRYHEDWEPVKAAGGVLIYVQRDNDGKDVTDHSSENSISQDDADYVIFNSSNLKNLEVLVRQVVNRIEYKARLAADAEIRAAQSGTPYDH
jgi:hypothetical protein